MAPATRILRWCFPSATQEIEDEGWNEGYRFAMSSTCPNAERCPSPPGIDNHCETMSSFGLCRGITATREEPRHD